MQYGSFVAPFRDGGTEVGERMRGVGPGRYEEGLGPLRGGLGQRARLPLWVAVLVDQQRADAFGEIAMGRRVERCDVFDAIDLRQRGTLGQALQLEREPR